MHEKPPFSELATAMQMVEGKYVYEVVAARELWEEILRSTYEYAEPGVIFIDRVNNRNNLSYLETIRATNPCGEQPLPPNGCCLLSAINLARFVKEPFSSKARIDPDLLREVVHAAIRFMDNVIDTTLYPLKDQFREEQAKRRIGLGITGLANMLDQLGIQYGSADAIEKTEEVMRSIAIHAYTASIELAEDRGAFPSFNHRHHSKRPFMEKILPRLTNSTRETYRKYGIRNGVLLTIAPTGTTSIAFGNVSGGLEPVFAHRLERRVRQADGEFKEVELFDYGAAVYKHLNTWVPKMLRPFPEHMVKAFDISPHGHLIMQEACQEWVDASISKTINCDADISFDEFREVYAEAYARGLKGCTTYRPSEVRGSILTDLDSPSEVTVDPANFEGNLNRAIAEERADETPVRSTSESTYETAGAPAAISETLVRPRKVVGETYKLRWPHLDSALYLTINSCGGRPIEIFLNTKDPRHKEWTDALMRMISALWRKGGNTSFITQELREIHAISNGAWVDKKYHPSLVAYIGYIIEEHLEEHGHEHESDFNSQWTPMPSLDGKMVTFSVPKTCPECGAPGMVHKEGCSECPSCSYSSCS